MPVASQDLAGFRDAQAQKKVEMAFDTVTARRGALVTSILSQGEKLSYSELKDLYRGTPAAAPAGWSQSMRIAAPVLAVGGLALGAVALKGTKTTSSLTINDKTSDYTYTVRSKPKLAAGLVLLAGGLCLFEWSNDLLAKSARLYNWDQVKKAGGLKAQLGVTQDGVGLVMKF